jgi:hypothetical protein
MSARFRPLVIWALCLISCALVNRNEPLRDESWLAAAQRQIAEREYRASENVEGLQAPNRAHNLRTYFQKTGIRVHDRTAEGSPELLGLSLAKVGRGDVLQVTGPGTEVVPEEKRVEIRRDGLVEWYVNSESGLEQGFELAQRPDGEGPLALELALSGAHPSLRGDAVALVSGARTLRYGALLAQDAERRALAAHLELLGSDRLRIVVDDANAVYPIEIDPLITNTADAQLESNQTNAQLGWSVAGAGDVNGDGYADVIVGAPSYDNGDIDEGAAFVFQGSATGIANANPSSPGVKQLESNQASASLGYSVASAGDVNGDGYADVIVGAPGYTAGQSGEGAAFVFLGSASGIASGGPSTASAQVESNQVGAGLGFSVAGAGDVNGDGYADVIVGAWLYANGQSQEGAAFIFLGSASGIASGNPASPGVAQLESNFAGARLGRSVAGAGDVNADGYADVIVGADGYDNGQSFEGFAFVFPGSASGIASGNPASPGVAKLESNQANANLGYSVAGAGDVNGDGYADVIVGAPNYDNGQSNEGAAFVFLGSSSGIASSNPSSPGVARLESDQASAGLGISVAGAGDVNGDGYADVIVGANAYDAGQADEGAAFVFLGSALGVINGTPATAAAQLELNQASADFGRSVAGVGDVNGDGYADVVAGAAAFSAGQAGEGAAFVYLGGGKPAGGPRTFLAPNQAGAQTRSAAGAGDVNGDGYGDVIVGVPFYDNGQTDEGAAFVFLGSASGIASGNPTLAAATLESNQANSLFANSVAGAGDVNGDGYADVIVGAPALNKAFVFLGSATGIANGNPTTAASVLQSTSPFFGWNVAGAGDVTGDGYSDVIVGAPGSIWPDNNGPAGNAYVFLGSGSGIASGSPATRTTGQSGDLFGWSVAGAGDLNGDGYADVIVGAPFYNSPDDNEGSAFVYLGSASGIATGSSRLESNQAGSNLGFSVAGAGDVNGDGYADVIVGAQFYSSQSGAAFVFTGSASGIASGNPATAAATLDASPAIAQFGWSVAGAGDWNGDGYADVVVGAPQYANNQSGQGAAFVFTGSASGIANGGPVNAAAQLASNQAQAEVGSWVAGAGDVNADGYADVLAVAPNASFLQSGEGLAYLFLGNSPGRPVLARQRRGDGSGVAVQPWGASHSATGFTAELRASHPQGTGRVKAQLQACPPAVPFGHASCANMLTPTWITVNGATPEVLLSQTFSGLTNNTLYRWRARILHAPKTGPTPTNPAHGPWRHFGAQSVEADIRLPEPGLLLSVASGIVLLRGLSVRRRRTRRVTDALR